MKTIFKVSNMLLFILTSYITFAQNSYKEGEVEKKKNITQTYELATTDKVYIKNIFGNIQVITWGENKIKIDITIEVGAKTEAKATKLIDGITVNHSKENGLVTFRTITGSQKFSFSMDNDSKPIFTNTSATETTTKIDDKKNEKVKKVKNNKTYTYTNNTRMQINYVVYLPATTTFKIKNEFGNISMVDYAGQLDINCQYGNLVTGNLTGNKNDITVQFGNTEIKTITNSTVKIQYGNCDIAGINGKGNLKFLFSGDVNIGINDSTKNVDIKNEYSTLEITLSDNTNANFEVISKFGEVKNKQSKLTIKDDDLENETSCCNFTRTYKGNIGSGLSKIKIESNSGKVKFR